MRPHLDNIQAKLLQDTLVAALERFEVQVKSEVREFADDDRLIDAFLAAKQTEGCSPKTLKYYNTTILIAKASIGKCIKDIQTDDLRNYLTSYQQGKNLSKVTVDNVRRILSSFFNWLEDENYILKSPVRRIHKIKTTICIKETYSDESLEQMRDGSPQLRDVAMIDMFSSTGVRVGEMVLLNRDDIDFENRECIVLGKGDKERIVYFDARTKIHLQEYLEEFNADYRRYFDQLAAVRAGASSTDGDAPDKQTAENDFSSPSSSILPPAK